jgi:hypothetical protein
MTAIYYDTLNEAILGFCKNLTLLTLIGLSCCCALEGKRNGGDRVPRKGEFHE